MDAYDKGDGPSLAAAAAPRRLRSPVFGATALFISIVALALAALPMLVFERPRPSFQESRKPVADEPEGRYSLTWRNFRFSFGRPKIADDEAVRAEHEAKQRAAAATRTADTEALQRHETRLQWFTLASAGFALLGLAIGPIAWARERHPALAGCAMAISGVALLWQYIIMGIVVGIVVVIVLATISAIGS